MFVYLLLPILNQRPEIDKIAMRTNKDATKGCLVNGWRQQHSHSDRDVFGRVAAPYPDENSDYEEEEEDSKFLLKFRATCNASESSCTNI